MAFQGSYYIATFDLAEETKKIEVIATDDSDARKKVLILYPNAKNLVIASKK